MLFPTLRDKTFGYVNLNTEAQRWLRSHGSTGVNPLLDPFVCDEMVQELHARLGIDYSYGGWLEDRSDLWRGSYLDAPQTYVHLGVDFNVPAGTAVAADQGYHVLMVGTDFPLEGGWGTHVIVKNVHTSGILLFAHLQDGVNCEVGDLLSKGDVFAYVGKAPQNGGWFPHLHVQCIDPDFFARMTPIMLDELDGYGAAEDIGMLARWFKDPLNVLSLRGHHDYPSLLAKCIQE